jgi:hypothetical protein
LMWFLRAMIYVKQTFTGSKSYLFTPHVYRRSCPLWWHVYFVPFLASI